MRSASRAPLGLCQPELTHWVVNITGEKISTASRLIKAKNELYTEPLTAAALLFFSRSRPSARIIPFCGPARPLLRRARRTRNAKASVIVARWSVPDGTTAGVDRRDCRSHLA